MSRTAANLIGRTFGRLTIEHRAGTIGGSAAWRCSCRCGKSTTVRSSSLISGATMSCGCLRVETSAALARGRTAGHHRRYTVDEIFAKTFSTDPRELLKRLGIA